MSLAWSDLGVPERHLMWLTVLDEEGLTFFLSPYMSNRLQTRDEDDLLQPSSPDASLLTNTSLAFKCERGVTQGDTMPTICWVAILDLIMSLIDPDETCTDTAYVCRRPRHVLFDT